MKDYDIRECSNEEADFVIDKLVEYNLSKVASTQEIDFLNIDRVVEDVKGNIIAGILAKMYCWNCLYIDVLWVEEGYRKDGLGSKLLKEIENMEQLVKEILSISKLEMNTMSHTELLSLSNILKRVYKHLIPLANEKHIRIQKNISEDVMMMGNELLLEKAVHNIISNAIRHSPVGAELGLELSFDSLLVRNSGVNIPDEDLDKLFTPFYCVEKSHNKLTGGSGLGLYLVKIILEQHGLSYTIENRQDSVCFKITLNSHNLN